MPDAIAQADNHDRQGGEMRQNQSTPSAARNDDKYDSCGKSAEHRYGDILCGKNAFIGHVLKFPRTSRRINIDK
jgi:hypothetical protein